MDVIKLTVKKQNIDPMWNVVMKQIGLGEPTSFLDHVFFWVALNGSAKRAKILSVISERCLNPGSPQEHKKNYPVQGDVMQTSPHGLLIWMIMQRNVWSDIAS